MKEEGYLSCEWIPGETNSMDLFTKNIGGSAFKEHTVVYYRTDEY